jgi:hypothetical protein
MENEVEFGNVIRELVAEAKVLGAEVERIGEPPSPTQLHAVQEGINRLQRKLNKLQTEADDWSEQTEL